jgi:hypothetical protein
MQLTFFSKSIIDGTTISSGGTESPRSPARCFVFVILSLLFLAACTFTPRVSVWDAPKRFTQNQVFNAGLQAGAQLGWQLTSSSKDAGTMSFRSPLGMQELVLSATVKTASKNKVQVSTTAHISTDPKGVMFAAGTGQHEIYINNFHEMLFRNLGITNTSEQNISIQALQ